MAHHHRPHLAKPQPPQPPKHSDTQLGAKLSGILNHPHVQDRRRETAHAMLALKEEHYSADDVKQLMSATSPRKQPHPPCAPISPTT
jgi:hypothetical protein